jgi:NADH-quinone oxidoreductase subunit N
VDFSSILPAGLLTVGLLGVLIVDLIDGGKRPGAPAFIALLSLLGAGLVALFAATSGKGSHDIVLGVLRADTFSTVLTVFFCAVGLLTIIATMRGEAFPRPGGEFLVLILASVIGMCFLVMSIDLIVLYLAFETVSITSYVLVGMRRADPKANEASLKYVLFGAVSSGLMLYGLSFIVGLAGGTSLEALGAAMHNGAGSQPIFLVACVLVFAGFAFKISAVPFHFWAPDVYAGAPASVGGFLAVASKAAGFAALVRVVAAVTPEPIADAIDPMTAFLPEGNALIKVIAISAVLTMIIGNLGALKSKEIKRLLAWSSIAHAGYIMLAICVWSDVGLVALMIYLISYLFMNMAAFFIAGVAIRDLGTGELTAFRGLRQNNLGLSVMLAFVLVSLTGLPPLLGFVAKYNVFYAVFAKGYFWLGVVGLITGVISLYYYVRIIQYMFLDDVEEGTPAPKVQMAFVDRVFCAAMVLPLIVFGLLWGPILDWAKQAVPMVFGGG